jgi:hypothetical protein
VGFDEFSSSVSEKIGFEKLDSNISGLGNMIGSILAFSNAILLWNASHSKLL